MSGMPGLLLQTVPANEPSHQVLRIQNTKQTKKTETVAHLVFQKDVSDISNALAKIHR